LFTFVIPHYDDWPRLKKLLDSILVECKRADCSAVETVVVDDASPGAKQILESLSRDYSWAQFTTNERNCGPGVSRNRGVEIAQSKWIWFLDSDVYLAEGAIIGMLALLEERSDLIGIGCGVGVEPVSTAPFERYKNYIEYSWQPPEGPTYSLDSKSFLVRREEFQKIKGFGHEFESPNVEDYDLGYRLIQAGVPLYFTHRAKICHHHPGLTRQFTLFYSRARDWMLLQRIYGIQSDDYGTSKTEGLLQVVACLIPFATTIALFYTPAILLLGIVAASWTYLNRRPLKLVIRRHEGSLFLIRFSLYSIVLSYAVCAGAFVGLTRIIFTRLDD